MRAIVVVSWNVLADLYIRRSYYPRSPARAKGGRRPDGCATFVARDLPITATRELAYGDGSGHVALITTVGDLAIANTHLKWDAPDTAAGARHGLREAEELLAVLPRTRALACGDFNVEPGDEVLARFTAAGFTDVHAAPTAVIAGRAKRIDYLLATGDLRVSAGAVPAIADDTVAPGLREPSDHVPVAIEIAL